MMIEKAVLVASGIVRSEADSHTVWSELGTEEREMIWQVWTA
jgi:hypothetical protein